MTIHFVLLFNRQGKIRLSQWVPLLFLFLSLLFRSFGAMVFLFRPKLTRPVQFDVYSQKERARTVRDIHAAVVKRGGTNKFFPFVLSFVGPLILFFAGRKQCNIIEYKEHKVASS